MTDDRGLADDVLGIAARGVVETWRDAGRGLVVVLTGAGVSAESGIPTFRGGDGFWTVGSRNYTAQELATWQSFQRAPETVWQFYLSRIARYGPCQPNAAHHALVELERALGDDFLLVTQNVDGLHRRAGSSGKRCYEIHGDLGLVRCAADCGAGIAPLPPTVRDRLAADGAIDDQLGATLRAALRCGSCGDWLRPHVLWFDECYDEAHFRFDSTLAAMQSATLLVVVGTSGATTLPNLAVEAARLRKIPWLVIGLDDSPFTVAAHRDPRAAVVRAAAGAAVPALVAAVLESST